jgi:hypothetical protein
MVNAKHLRFVYLLVLLYYCSVASYLGGKQKPDITPILISRPRFPCRGKADTNPQSKKYSECKLYGSRFSVAGETRVLLPSKRGWLCVCVLISASRRENKGQTMDI